MARDQVPPPPPLPSPWWLVELSKPLFSLLRNTHNSLLDIGVAIITYLKAIYVAGVIGTVEVPKLVVLAATLHVTSGMIILPSILLLAGVIQFLRSNRRTIHDGWTLISYAYGPEPLCEDKLKFYYSGMPRTMKKEEGGESQPSAF